jgi:hypothetical protein
MTYKIILHGVGSGQFNLENLTTNSTLKELKSIEIKKDPILILQIYRVYEKKGREECPAFLRKKKGEELTKGGTGTRHPLLSDGIVTGGDLIFLQRDHDRRPCGTSSFGGTVIGGHSNGTGRSTSSCGSWRRPCGTRTFSSSGGTAAVMGCNNETYSSPMFMRFVLGTSSSLSLKCVMPNSSFIVSNVICKKRQYTQIVSFLRERAQYF